MMYESFQVPEFVFKVFMHMDAAYYPQLQKENALNKKNTIPYSSERENGAGDTDNQSHRQPVWSGIFCTETSHDNGIQIAPHAKEGSKTSS
jgi:hypothetical protein